MRWVVLLAWLTGVLVLNLWFVQQAQFGLQRSLALASMGLWVLLGYRGWRWLQQLPTGVLSWSRALWQVHSGNHAVLDLAYASTCRCVCDLGSAMLLQIGTHTVGQPSSHTWVWVQQKHAPTQWLALRHAVMWADAKGAVRVGVMA